MRAGVLSLLVVRGTIVVAIACLATALVAGSSSHAPAPAGPAVAHADAAQVLIVGDSLAVGMQPFLADMITDREVTFDAKAGRTTPQGLRALRFELQRYAPQAVVISLGTNDGSDPHVFADRIRRTLRAVPPSACVVWPAIARPPRKGAYKQLNTVLREAARHDQRLTVIDWDHMVAKGTVALRDGIHPDADGYRFRSWVTAAAVERGCPQIPSD
jgi:lysophospholipase L1-like esterase